MRGTVQAGRGRDCRRKGRDCRREGRGTVWDPGGAVGRRGGLARGANHCPGGQVPSCGLTNVCTQAVKQTQLYSAPWREGTAGRDWAPGAGIGARRFSRAPSISSQMARHRGTWKQPAGRGETADSELGGPSAVECSEPLQPRPVPHSPLKGPPLMVRTTEPSRFR